MASLWHLTDGQVNRAPHEKRYFPAHFAKKRYVAPFPPMPKDFVNNVRALRLEGCSKSYSIAISGGTMHLAKNWAEQHPELAEELSKFKRPGNNATKAADTWYLEKVAQN